MIWLHSYVNLVVYSIKSANFIKFYFANDEMEKHATTSTCCVRDYYERRKRNASHIHCTHNAFRAQTKCNFWSLPFKNCVLWLFVCLFVCSLATILNFLIILFCIFEIALQSCCEGKKQPVSNNNLNSWVVKLLTVFTVNCERISKKHDVLYVVYTFETNKKSPKQ